MIVTQAAMAPPETAADSFEGFFREHFGRVYSLLYRVTGSAEEAEDLAQELFLQAYHQRPPLWESPTAGGWLWKAAGHMALNALRGSRRRRDREARAQLREQPLRLIGDGAEDPAEALARREQQEEVRAVLRQLKQRDTELLLLRHSGLSYADIARALSLNPASVGTLLARAETRFRAIYESRSTDTSPKEEPRLP